MLKDKGVIWDDEPGCFKHGSFIKRVPRIVEPYVVRSEYKEIDTNLTKFNDEINEFLKCDIYNEITN